MSNKSLNCTANGTGMEKSNRSNYYIIPLQLVIALLILILLVNFIGNTIVVLVIINKRKMQTFTNWLILNLAVADLSVALFCIPLEIPLEINHEWIYGKFFCNIFYPIQSATIYGSVFTLVVLSCCRYSAIIHPFRRQPKKFEAKVLICIIWVSSLLLVTPYMMGLKYNGETKECMEVWSNEQRRIYTIATFTIQYVLPLTIIIVAYAFIIYEIALKKGPSSSLYEDKQRNEESKKLIKLLLIITTTFALCVLPYHVVALSLEFGNGESFKYIEDVSLGAYLLLYLNSAFNPVIYNVFSSSFREAFTESHKRIWNYLRDRNRSNSSRYFRQSSRSDSTVTYQQSIRLWEISSQDKEVTIDSSEVELTLTSGSSTGNV